MSGRNSNGATQRHANTATDDQTSSKAADGTPDGTCSYCNDSGNVKTCSGCKKTQYCSRVCQKADWKSHKHRCDAHKQVLIFSYLYRNQHSERFTNSWKFEDYRSLFIKIQK